MPTGGIFHDMVDRPQETTGLEDPGAVRLALELHMLNMGEPANVVEPIMTDNTPADFSSTYHNPLVTHSPMDDVVRAKKSQNMTECVPVPSSEHVAEIVGRQGCKIKALRAKTNTYIKTPVRHEEPVFVVTGRKEDVAKAKREILSAAEHFSQIRASRKTNLAGLGTGASSPPGPPAVVPGHITIQVRVPYRVVGLVVGPKGATIKRIQHQTHTYIVTPSRDKEPIFEVTGLPESVETARKEIEAHIAVRTGNGTSVNGNDTALIDENALFASLYKSGLTSIMEFVNNQAKNIDSSADIYNGLMNTSVSSTEAFSSSASCSSSSSSIGRDFGNIWGSAENDEGLGDSPNLERNLSNIWSYPSSTAAPRPTPSSSASPTDSLLGITKCFLCSEAKVTHAMIPCGHKIFCKDCAMRVDSGPNAQCPACKMAIIGVCHIISPTNLPNL